MFSFSRDNKSWKTSQIKLLLDVRLRYEDEFVAGRKKKSVLWGRILDEIKKVDANFPFNKEELNRKFLNLTITYKRIKKRNGESGRNSTYWEFFDTFDEVYGTRHSVAPPSNMMLSSLELDDSRCQTPGSSSEIFGEFPAESSSNSFPTTSTPTHRRAKKRANEDPILKFLKEEAAADKERFERLAKLEEEKVRNDRERIEVLRDIKTLLHNMLQ